MCNVVHEAENVSDFLVEVKRVLAEAGKIAIIDWMKQQSPIGLAIDHRIATEELLTI